MARKLLITQRERRIVNAWDGFVMVPDTTDRILMRGVLQSLQLQPKAADTMDGILKWWCKRQGNGQDAEVKKTIIDELVNG